MPLVAGGWPDGDHWATPDGRVYVGNPFSTLGSLLMLHELGLGTDHEAVRGGLDLVLEHRGLLPGAFPRGRRVAVQLHPLVFRARGEPSTVATHRFRETEENVGG